MESGHPRSTSKTENAMSTGTIIIRVGNEWKLLRKIDLRVLPVITVIYILAFLDR